MGLFFWGGGDFCALMIEQGGGWNPSHSARNQRSLCFARCRVRPGMGQAQKYWLLLIGQAPPTGGKVNITNISFIAVLVRQSSGIAIASSRDVDFHIALLVS